jgi:hypothetical protein
MRVVKVNKHNTLISEIILSAFQIKTNILNSRQDYYILKTKDYKRLLKIKLLIIELEELDTLLNKNDD